MGLLYLSDTQRGEIWRGAFAKGLPDLPFLLGRRAVSDPSEIRYIAAWTLPSDLPRFENLEVIFSVGAGVDQIDLARLPKGVKVVRMLDPGINNMMRGYVAMAVLSLHRGLPAFLDQQRKQIWAVHRARPATDLRVGVLGLGQLAQSSLKALEIFGYQLMGWSRTPKTLDGVTCYNGQDGLAEMLARTDILINLLPLTAATKRILNANLFSQLPMGTGLIHTGRGAQLDHDALIEALDAGQIGAAFIDVTEPEPLPTGHAFWKHPGIILTPHIAAHTDAVQGAAHVIAGIRAHRNGARIEGEVDLDVGY